jgi:hypothetical protein
VRSLLNAPTQQCIFERIAPKSRRRYFFAGKKIIELKDFISGAFKIERTSSPEVVKTL